MHMEKILYNGGFDMTGNKAKNFNEMDDFEFGVSLYESEMEETYQSEEQSHMNRCVIKGKRAKRKQRNDLFWWRHREWPSWVGNVLADRRRNAKVRRDNVMLRHDTMHTHAEDYDEVDVMPAKARRY